MQAYIIVPAEASDAESIEQIEKECLSLPLNKEQILSQIEDERYTILCAKGEDSCILGYAGMYCVLDEGYITNVAVSAAARRNHIADALLSGLQMRSEELKLTFLTLEVRESNIPAITLYRKHGFEKADLRKDYYQAPKENAVIMTKFFSEEKT